MGEQKIVPKKLHNIVKNHLRDVVEFLKYVKMVIKDPGKWGLKIS